MNSKILAVLALQPSNYYVERYEVLSHSDTSKTYVVAMNKNGGWECSCPHWKFRRANGSTCKHIDEVIQQKAGRKTVSPVTRAKSSTAKTLRAPKSARGARVSIEELEKLKEELGITVESDGYT